MENRKHFKFHVCRTSTSDSFHVFFSPENKKLKHSNYFFFPRQTDKIDAMNDEQLKEYLKNRPEELKTVKIQKSKPRQKVRRFLFIYRHCVSKHVSLFLNCKNL